MTDPYYGEAPVDLGPLNLPGWHEFMHYLYLPVRMPLSDTQSPGGLDVGKVRRGASMGFLATGGHERMYFPRFLPERLRFLERAIWAAFEDAWSLGFGDPYIYVTARRGFATPGNPLNRPGWHCDDFGGTDLNYIWADRWPTRILRSDDPLNISDDDAESMSDMDLIATVAANGGYDGDPRIVDAPVGHLLRLSPYVIHDTPVIPAPGGMRSFFKISVSTHRYNLIGNSHNHLLDYDWPMHDRAAVRNQPGGNADYVKETP